MVIGYINFVMKEISPMFDLIADHSDRKVAMAATMSRFMNCDCITDLAESGGPGKLVKAISDNAAV